MSFGFVHSAGSVRVVNAPLPVPSAHAEIKTVTPVPRCASAVMPVANFVSAATAATRHYRPATTPACRCRGAIAQLCTTGTEVSAALHRARRRPHRASVPESSSPGRRRLALGWRDDINSCSIVVEIINRGHEWGYPIFRCARFAAVIALFPASCSAARWPSHRVALPFRRRPRPQKGSRRKVSPGMRCQFRRRRTGTNRPPIGAAKLSSSANLHDVARMQLAFALRATSSPTEGIWTAPLWQS